MGKTIQVGLAGFGAMGVTHWKAYQKMRDVQVVAIADADAAKKKGDVSMVRLNGRRIAEDTVDLTGIRTFGNVPEMLESMPDLDMIDICLPTFLHIETIRLGLNARKHVFCEKPLSLDFEENDEIFREIRESDRFFNLGLCLRVNPVYLHARKMIRSGAAGKIRSAVFTRYSGSLKGWFSEEKKTGGALLDLHIHDTDIINSMFGPPEAVSCFGAQNVISPESGCDQFCTVYHYSDGALVMAEGGWAAAGIPFERSFLIVGEKATLQFKNEKYIVATPDGVRTCPFGEEPKPVDNWFLELQYFTDCIRANIPPDQYQTPEEIAATCRILHAEMQSLRNGTRTSVEPM